MSMSLVLRALFPRREPETDEAHIASAARWLLEAQRAGGGGGYAHSFHLLRGWQAAYPETTGYIIPTLCRAAAQYGMPELHASVASAVRWLDAIQRGDGAFCDLQGLPRVFDTGQILIGFTYLAQHAPELADIERLKRAARWICAVQEPDGSFVLHAYNGVPHAYYARVGAALVTAGRLTGEGVFWAAGLANLRWTLARQQANGFFRNLSFDSLPPYLHTMIYVIEGLLDGYGETGDASFLAAAARFGDELLRVSRERDHILRSQYNEDFTVANGEKCLVGLAQWAGACFRLARLGTGEAYFEEGMKTLDYLKQRQIRSSDPRLDGALMGSSPPWGRYMRLACPNWGMKFFMDALMMTRMPDEE